MDTAYCINLKTRQDRRSQIKKQFRNKTKVVFHRVMKNTDGATGCRDSHLELIKMARDNGFEYIWIVEDDVVLSKNFKFPDLPLDFDLVYLGGTITKKMESYDDIYNIAKGIYATHSYIISKKMYDTILNNATVPIDSYYVSEIQGNYKCYILKEPNCHQRKGYSDIENRNVDYSELVNERIEYQSVSTFLQIQSESELPFVSVITPTRNRIQFLELMLDNLNNSNYPKNSLEWIIVDDSDTRILKDKLPLESDFYIRYCHLKSDNSEPITISYKRNYAIQRSKGSIIIHMDDDDIYDPDSILIRVLSLVDNCKCVGSNVINVSDLVSGKSGYIGDTAGTLFEATMGYTRDFWSSRKFNEKFSRGEGLLFLKDRQDFVRLLPGDSIIKESLTHGDNITGDMRALLP